MRLSSALIPLLVITAAQVVDAQSRSNLAMFQRVTSSSVNGTYFADFAVDGLVNNFNSYRTANVTTPHWLEVTFPRAVPIGSAHLYLGLDNNSGSALTQFSFQIFVDGVWQVIPGTTRSGNTQTELVVNFPAPVTTDRIRLLSTSTGNRTIRELALFPPNRVDGVEVGYPLGTDVRLSLSHQRPILGSSIFSNGFPKLAVDGYVHDNSRWLSNTVAADQTLDIDLLVAHSVGSVHLYSGFEGGEPLADGVVEYLSGTDWQPIPGGSFTGNTSQSLVLNFTSPVTTSRIRLRNTGISRSRVREILVFPPRAGGIPLGQDVIAGPPPIATFENFSDSTWRLRNGGPDLRLSLLNGSVILGRASDGAATIGWQLLLNVRDGSYRIRHTETGLCLALGELSRDPGTPVVAETYSGLPHQDWRLQSVGTNVWRLVNVFSGHAIQPSGGSWSYGTLLVTAIAGADAVQRWEPISPVHHPKKGLASVVANFDSYLERFPSAWSYTWGRQRPSSFTIPESHSFNPMQWGNFSWAHGSGQGPIDLLRGEMNGIGKPIHLLGFNEPDASSQSNMTPELAAERWPRLEALGVPLVAPVPATLAPWLDEYVALADPLGYRRDYTAVHWYGTPNADSLISTLQAAYTKYGRPIWLTEFSTVRWSGTSTWTHATNFNFLAEFLWRAESLPWLKRYALFHFVGGTVGDPNQSAPDPTEAPRGNSLLIDGTMTPYGELYAGWDGVAAVVNEKAYHLHNRGAYRRARNGGASTPNSVATGTVADGQQWFLVPGTTTNTVRILSTKDARPLAYTDVGGLVFAAAGTTTTATEWRLENWQYGWYYIAHPATATRLRLTSSGTWSLVAASSTSENDRWRLVVPMSPERLGPPHPLELSGPWLETALAAFPAEQRLGSVDADRDGMPNLLEFVFLSNPASGGASPLALASSAPGSVTLTFPWNWRAAGVRWQVRRGQSLADRAAWAVVAPAAQTTTRDGDVDRLSVTIPLEGSTGGFVVLEVIED